MKVFFNNIICFLETKWYNYIKKTFVFPILNPKSVCYSCTKYEYLFKFFRGWQKNVTYLSFTNSYYL